MTTLRARAVLAVSAGLASTGLVFAASPASARSTCRNGTLAISHVPPEGATGHGSFVLLFKNVTGNTCTLHGYPRLDALDASGHVLARAQRTMRGFAGGAHAERAISVMPRHYASVKVEWLNAHPATGASCTFSNSVAITPAKTMRTVRIAVSVNVCRLQVHPIVAGTSGNE